MARGPLSSNAHVLSRPRRNGCSGKDKGTAPNPPTGGLCAGRRNWKRTKNRAPVLDDSERVLPKLELSLWHLFTPVFHICLKWVYLPSFHYLQFPLPKEFHS